MNTNYERSAPQDVSSSFTWENNRNIHNFVCKINKKIVHVGHGADGQSPSHSFVQNVHLSISQNNLLKWHNYYV